MATLRQAQANARKVNPLALEREIFNIVRRIETDMTALNRDQLFKNSEDIFGNAIGFYSPATQIITGGRKKAGDPYTMFDIGDFIRQLFARVKNEEIVFGSDDSKVDKILGNRRLLSKSLFGLTDSHCLRPSSVVAILPFWPFDIFSDHNIPDP